MDDSQSDDEELLNNEDYRNLQEVISSLKKQRDRALKNVNLLQQLKEDALANPMQFVADLKEKKLVNFPSRQEISILPIIDFSKYQRVAITIVVVLVQLLFHQPHKQNKTIITTIAIITSTIVPTQIQIQITAKAVIILVIIKKLIKMV